MPDARRIRHRRHHRSERRIEQQPADAVAAGIDAGVPVRHDRLLIGLGADPSIRDARFDSTPLGWAEHFQHQAVADFLRPLTTAQ